MYWLVLLLLLIIQAPAKADWFNGDWLYRVKVTIDNTKVAASLTDFPVYVDLSDLPSDFFDNVNSDGSDIRVTKADGETQVPVEVVDISTGSETGELHFKATGTLSGSTDTSFYIYYGNAAASMPAVSSTYGRNAVWSDYAAVYHMNQDPSGSAPQILDSTANNNHGTSFGSMTSGDLVAGKLNKALDFDGTNDYIDFGNDASLQITNNLSVECWFNGPAGNQEGMLGKASNTTSNQSWLINSNSNSGTGTTDIRISNTTGTSTSANSKIARAGAVVLNNNWNHLAFTFANNSLNHYVNGVADSRSYVWNATVNTLSNVTEPLKIGGNLEGTASDYKAMKTSELRISNVVRSANWYLTQYNNQNSPSTFYSVGAQEAPPGWYDTSWKYRIKLEIDTSKIAATLTNFPVYVNLADLPADFFTNVKSDGGDIRITSRDGETKLPVEVVDISTGGETGEIHFKASTLSTSENVFYLYYGNASASMPAVTDTYGRNAVWSDYEGVWHMNEDPSGSAPQMVDSTGNSNDGTSAGSMTSGDLVTAQIEKGLDFDGTNDVISCSNNYALTSVVNKTISAWAKHTAASANDAIAALWGSSGHYIQSGLSSTDALLTGVGTTAYGVINTTTTGSLRHIVSTYDGSLSNNSNRLKLFINASQQSLTFTGTVPASYTVGTGATFKIGDLGGFSRFWDGIIDEVRITASTLSANWITTEYNNQSSPSTFYSVVALDVLPSWYDNNFLYRQKITIDATKVAADLTDFPIYLDTDDLSTGFYTNAKSDCSDVRITLADGTTEIPREIVFCDGTNGEIHFKAAGTLSGSFDTSYYIYYGNAAASDYAVSATYGRNNVWSDYAAVYHMNEDPSGSAPQMIDSTGNSNDGTSAGSMTSGDLVTGKLGEGIDFDGTNDYIDLANRIVNATGNVSYSSWAKPNTTSGVRVLAALAAGTAYRSGLYQPDNVYRFSVNSASTFISTSSANVNNWTYLVGTYDTSTTRLYAAGSQVASSSSAQTTLTTETAFIGSRGGVDLFFSGVLDEIRFTNSVLSANWITTEYNNQSSPSTFYSAEAEEANSVTVEDNFAIFFGTVF